MQKSGTFYESDVLERLRSLVAARAAGSTAIDVGAFIGTHSVYFARFCGLRRVIAFESNPAAFAVLVANVHTNGLDDSVFPINKALGSQLGYADVVAGSSANQGTSRVRYTAEHAIDRVPASTLDDEIMGRDLGTVALIKIDVEGAELEVLRGASETIGRDRPVMCIEIHTPRHLMTVLATLYRNQYWILDCLGYSPTYILATGRPSLFRRRCVNVLWLVRAAVPAPFSAIRWYLKRLAQLLAADYRDRL
jgi:FkbM family methyltransferase